MVAVLQRIPVQGSSLFICKEVGGSMKVQVIGAGSVGLLMATFLVELGHDVTVVSRNREQKQRLANEGITRVNLDGSMYHCIVDVKASLVCDVQLTIVTTKSYQLAPLYEVLQPLPRQSTILFMQNGLAHYDEALQLPQRIAFASVQFGALKEQPTVVKHTGIGVIKIASAQHDATILKSSLSHIPVQYEVDAFKMLFEKALLNCFVNPLTAILQVKNGVLVQNAHAFTLLQQLYKELGEAFPMEMAQFSFDLVVSLCEKTAQNHSSMLMDRISNRTSEIDAIVLPIIRRGQAKGHSLPILQTLYYLVKANEAERGV